MTNEYNPTDGLSNATATANDTVNRAAKMAHDAIDKVAAKAAPALDQLQSAASNASKTFQDKAEALGQLEEEWMDTTRTYVRENPITAVLAAVAAGVLISRLIR